MGGAAQRSRNTWFAQPGQVAVSGNMKGEHRVGCH